jgi:hypothetical protein
MRTQMNHRTAAEKRILVVATEPVGGAALRDAILGVESEPGAEVLVIAPSLNSRLRYWLSDEDGARRAAGVRLAASLAHLRAAGIEAWGMVSDADPLQAIADALHQFPAHYIAITALPDGRSHRLAHDLAARAQRRFALPVVDPADHSKHQREISTGSLSPLAQIARRIGRSGNGRRVAGVSRA